MLHKRAHVNIEVAHLFDFGERIRQERDRLGLSQEAFGVVGGVSKRAQVNYEKSERKPDLIYLNQLSKVGVDVLYLVTGQRSEAALPDDVTELVTQYQKAPLAVRAAVLRALAGDASETAGVNVRGSNNQIAGRDFNGSK